MCQVLENILKCLWHFSPPYNDTQDTKTFFSHCTYILLGFPWTRESRKWTKWMAHNWCRTVACFQPSSLLSNARSVACWRQQTTFRCHWRTWEPVFLLFSANLRSVIPSSGDYSPQPTTTMTIYWSCDEVHQIHKGGCCCQNHYPITCYLKSSNLDNFEGSY
jgi:hypothetical protein